MVDKIVELENKKNYLLLDEKELNNTKYYFGLRLNEDNEPTNNYLFFEEFSNEKDTFLIPIEEDNLKELLLTSFTINYLGKVYDEI